MATHEVKSISHQKKIHTGDNMMDMFTKHLDLTNFQIGTQQGGYTLTYDDYN